MLYKNQLCTLYCFTHQLIPLKLITVVIEWNYVFVHSVHAHFSESLFRPDSSLTRSSNPLITVVFWVCLKRRLGSHLSTTALSMLWFHDRGMFCLWTTSGSLRFVFPRRLVKEARMARAEPWTKRTEFWVPVLNASAFCGSGTAYVRNRAKCRDRKQASEQDDAEYMTSYVWAGEKETKNKRKNTQHDAVRICAQLALSWRAWSYMVAFL